MKQRKEQNKETASANRPYVYRGFIILLIAGAVILTYKNMRAAAKKDISPAVLNEAVITLERTMCEGTCPAYTLTVHGGGKVEYNGRSDVKTEGRQASQITPEKVKKLVQAFYDIGYFSLEDVYGNIHLDGSNTISSIKIDGKTKKTVNAGTVLEKLDELENMIDVVTRSALWVYGKPIEGSDHYRINGEEVPLDEFLFLKIRIKINRSSETSSNYETEKGVHGGTETRYTAINDKTGGTYRYSEYEPAGGTARIFEIAESSGDTSKKR